ncbi:MAG TPA: sulfur oxidation c-type cytochrome SoxA [Zoogloea sp.]|uniref:sulfur oxidation c-type cytochrome SoxA n=1 Tax=Zoogloea sp. TaxID=49181 RepID=UPI002CB99868|nr:sulfur oxidation c-type cytochrome SoxA [Zoogloea sp.]HMV17728.1 sulfur oxidation c-type cytochrome SoxA [Rhodocyclaceae bacterium]HMV62187.1 sulfur oxidation c-type cytochrome SoxA [Rhodocyclaceae bacterium]HMW51843.1 sulfur oxidation c-type cytochrome SoxA [Rhodocyclaceae bacterium]HMY49976.1 sulfur oxidation c-type cytochrome SoxA [Rhodocyclaceae bacterium]HMZ77731.1 sulfur oxidation c-type cytochrome SoxA [Rhodocyclaceae bacterium]
MRGFMRTALATAAVVLSAPVWAEGSTQDEIARYREMLAEGNPAELLEAKGEELWKKPRGPRNVSLERCDLGLGPGQVQGAYARLPRYFADTRQVMDVESRLVHCMVTLQGFTREEATRNWYSRPGKDSDIEALVTYIGGQSNGVAIDVPARHPEEARMARIGELIFYRRSGPQDFSCAICHGQEGKRIRLQELGKLTTRAGAGTAMANWPSYRVSQGAVWTMQRRLIDCMRQARWPEPEYLSDSVIALETFLQKTASGTVMQTPGIKR